MCKSIKSERYILAALLVSFKPKRISKSGFYVLGYETAGYQAKAQVYETSLWPCSTHTLQRRRHSSECFRTTTLIWNSLRRQVTLPRPRLKHRPEALAIYDPRLAPSTNHKYIQLRATNERCNKENNQRIKEYCDTRHYCSIASNASLVGMGFR